MSRKRWCSPLSTAIDNRHVTVFTIIDDGYGMDLTAPLHRAGDGSIADIFTHQPLPPQAVFYNNPSYYGLEIHSEVSDTDSDYGSAMDEAD
ncbi:hypothetical protein CYMTET_18935 [Cymbomonas tetramitiformis]|uniref:Uncharacterized protein n=1 Tax=Cymbomonas tetramitiformis TaxID=36881 RepID=A0AAE0G750_9CHLO|nr:hypothetical protein CYMTET_18935 [Cymbomonas tetramitiformis]